MGSAADIINMKTTILLCFLTTILCVKIIEATLVSHEYTMIHSKASKVLSSTSGWTSFPKTVEGVNREYLECAVRCSQDATCLSIYFSEGICYTGLTVPIADDFVASNTTTSSHYVKQ